VRLVGIHSGGAWIAERLHQDLRLDEPLGTPSSAFHRDDYGKRRYLPAESRQTELPFGVQGADLVLVGDILYTGRTVRAALTALVDSARPNRVERAGRIGRGGGERPIEAGYCGAVHALDEQARFEFSREADGRFALRLA